MSAVRVGPDSELPETDYDQPPQFTWKEFYDFRNHVIRTLRRFGSAGPLGEADLSIDDEDEEPAFEDGVVEEPDFFVVDDMWNEHDRLSVVESDAKHISAALMEALVDAAGRFPGWRVSMRLGDCGLNVFGDKVLVGGRRFWDCATVDELATRCARPVDYGAEEPFSNAAYALWVQIITGRFQSTGTYPAFSERQWIEAVRAMEDSRRRRGGGPLPSSAYGRVRYDLHPKTKSIFLRRFLSAISEFPQDAVAEARVNIQKDAGDALSLASDARERADLIQHISAAQEAVSDWLGGIDVVIWWPYVIDTCGNISEDLRRAVMGELRARLTFPNEWIQMSGVFSLALLGAEDIGDVVVNALAAHPPWSRNPELVEWLERLRRGSKMYPSFRHSL
jgi:hypothetical protein